MADYVDTSALVKWYLEEPLSSAFEAYVAEHMGARLSHGLCPECLRSEFGDGEDDK